MPWFHFFWTDENSEHIEQHGVTLDEFEEVVQNPDRLTQSASSGKPLAFGWTSTGKFIGCVYELLNDNTVYPITAFEPDDQ